MRSSVIESIASVRVALGAETPHVVRTVLGRLVNAFQLLGIGN
jgi:hypothetical protein